LKGRYPFIFPPLSREGDIGDKNKGIPPTPTHPNPTSHHHTTPPHKKGLLKKDFKGLKIDSVKL